MSLGKKKKLKTSLKFKFTLNTFYENASTCVVEFTACRVADNRSDFCAFF